MRIRSPLVLGTVLCLFALTLRSSLAQGTPPAGGEGITLSASPNALTVQWKAFSAEDLDYYKVSYARQSILESGQRDGEEGTFGKETSLILFDLEERGFEEGDTIYITVTAVHTDGSETEPTEEQSTTVLLRAPAPPPSPSSPPFQLDHALSQDPTNVILTFSEPVMLPEGPPAEFFTIRVLDVPESIEVISASTEGPEVLLRTLPMTPLTRYLVTISGVTSLGGASLDPAARQAVFVARPAAAPPSPEAAEPPEVPEILPTPPPDTNPPEDPEDLTLARKLQGDGRYTVQASWGASPNTAGDLSAYYLYESADLGATFLGPTALTATITSVALTDVPPGTLTVRVTAIDTSENESPGIQETIILPETGPALMLLFSIVGASFWTARRKMIYSPKPICPSKDS